MAIDFTVYHRVESDPGSDQADDTESVWSDSSNTSSDVTELEDDDFPRYFAERYGRLFHHHGNAPYPLPVDAEEQHRMYGQHVLLQQLLGSDYRSRVRCVLRDGGRVLDLCTGTGQWVLDTANDYPSVRFYGLDIVPIATRHPPDNVFFEMADVNAVLRYRNNLFDLVHARSISMAVTNYPALLQEVARVLHPGGMFMAGEWSRLAALDDNRLPSVHLPDTCAFYWAVNQALASRSIHPVYQNLEGWVSASGRFREVRTRVYKMPVGDWPSDAGRRALGIGFKNIIYMYASSMRIVLIEAGWNSLAVDDLIRRFLYEVDNVPGQVCLFKVVTARRTRH